MTNQKILFVDDEANVLHALKRLCRREAFATEFARSGAEALAIMARETIDLVVSDLRMSEMDGIKLLAEIEKLYPDVPRVLLSGNADLPFIIKALNEGKLSYCLEKPWEDDKVRLVLRQLLNQRSLHQNDAATLATDLTATSVLVVDDNETDLNPVQEFSRERFLKLKSEIGKGVINKLVASFRSDSEKRLMMLESLYAAADWQEFSNQCHVLGSSAGMFGALGLYRVCRKVESAYVRNEEGIVKDIAPNVISLIMPGVEKVESWLGGEDN